MIAKHIPMRCASLSSFSGLVDYLTDTQNKEERVEAVNITNCISDTAAAAVLEVRATQMRNTRARSDKTYHMLISFRAGENVELETLKKIEHEIVSALGFGEHQRISVVHTDTDNLHMHIAINRVHPTTYRVHDPWQSYRTMAATCARIEREYGLAVDNHEATRSISAGRARDMEQHTGQESLIGWIKRENITEQMRAAATWQDLHNVLGEHGLVIKERGNGLIIATADGKVTVKASTIDRNLSKAKLTAKMGEFEAAQGARKPAKKTYEKRPLGGGRYTGALWARYKSETERNRTARRDGLSKLRTQRNQRQRDAIAANRKRRAQIKASDCDRIRKRSLYQQASASLGIERRRASAEYWNGRMALRAQTPILSWADWLRAEAQKGDKAALAALRARDAAVRKREANGIAPGWSGKLTLTEAYYECRERMAARHERERIELLANYRARRAGLGGRNWQRDLSVLASQQVRARLEMKDRQKAESAKLLRIYTEALCAGRQITKTGTVIHNGLRDDGTAIRVSPGRGRKGIERAITLVSDRSFGAPIVVTGDAQHKARVIVAAAKTDTVLADPMLERKRQEVMNGRDGRSGAGRSLGARDERGGSNHAAGRGTVHQPAARSYGRPPGDCLRTLRALDVEQVTVRSPVLLSGNVRDRVEQPRAEQPAGVRWTPASTAALTPPPQQQMQPPQQAPRTRGR